MNDSILTNTNVTIAILIPIFVGVFALIGIHAVFGWWGILGTVLLEVVLVAINYATYKRMLG